MENFLSLLGTSRTILPTPPPLFTAFPANDSYMDIPCFHPESQDLPPSASPFNSF